MTGQISGEILQVIVRLSRERRRQRDITRIMGVTEGTISKILRAAWRAGFPNQRPAGHH